MEKKLWEQSTEGEDIYVYTLTNHNGMSATVMNYGANLLTLNVPDASGKTADVVLGFDKLENYFDNPACYGCCVCRNANRIGGASFTLNGTTYELEKNDGNNNLHSGSHALHHRVWDVTFLQEDGSYIEDETKASDQTITFTYDSPNMDMGFPGNMLIGITYTLGDDNSLRIDYHALSDEDTIFNPTNHSYFNLGGHDSGTVLNHEMQVYTEEFTYANEQSIPDGTIRKVAGTPMDFRKPKQIGDDIDADYDQLIWAKGYDHNFIVNKDNDETMTHAATLHDPISGRTMDVYTTLPGVHIYTGNFIGDADAGKNGRKYQPRDGVAFETQYYPNAINVPSFPQPVVKCGEAGGSSTLFKFS